MEGAVMAETTNNVTAKTEETPTVPQARRRFEGIRREIDCLSRSRLERRQATFK
jgi:hypothetical protein